MSGLSFTGDLLLELEVSKKKGGISKLVAAVDRLHPEKQRKRNDGVYQVNIFFIGHQNIRYPAEGRTLLRLLRKCL